MSGEAGGSPSSVLGSLDSPAHLEVVCGRWTVDSHLPSVAPTFLRVWACLGPLKPWHSWPKALMRVSRVDPPTVGVGVMRHGLCHSFRVPHLFCRQMSLRQCNCFLALTAKAHAGPTETHTAESQSRCKRASLEVPLWD